jgi:hypothetical protein
MSKSIAQQKKFTSSLVTLFAGPVNLGSANQWPPQSK